MHRSGDRPDAPSGAQSLRAPYSGHQGRRDCCGGGGQRPAPAEGAGAHARLRAGGSCRSVLCALHHVHIAGTVPAAGDLLCMDRHDYRRNRPHCGCSRRQPHPHGVSRGVPVCPRLDSWCVGSADGECKTGACRARADTFHALSTARAHGSARMNAGALLAAEGVSKSFDGFKVLDNVSFSVPERGLTGIVGTNGAGKSTLFAVVCGQHEADQGSVTFNDANITAFRPVRRAQLGLGRTFQVPREFPHLTVRENLLVAARREFGETLLSVFIGWNRVRREERILLERAEEWIEFLNLKGVAGKAAGMLSGGQKKLLEL